jgi:hypothetical protein
MDLEALAMNVCENFPWIVGMSVYLSYCIRNPSFQVAGESANNQELIDAGMLFVRVTSSLEIQVFWVN